MRFQEIQEACWTGYRQAGMKKKGDRMVPNCVPVNEQQQSNYILYLNGSPVAKFDNENDAEYQGRMVAKRVPDTRVEVKKETCTLTPVQLEENLKKWFKEKWVRFGPDGKIRGACARGSDSEGKPKCLPQSKAYALGKKKRASAAAKKRREDPNPERRGPAKNVATKVREDAVTDLKKDLANPASYDAIDHMMQSIAKKHDITAKQLHDQFVDEYGMSPDAWIKKNRS